MLPNGGKEVGFEEATPLPDDVEPLMDPLALLLRVVFPGPCWLKVELDACADADWFSEGKGCVKRELSSGCEARYGAEDGVHQIYVNNIQNAGE